MCSFIICPPGLGGAGPARDRAGVADPPDGGAVDPAAAGDGGRSALAGKRGEVSGNCVSSDWGVFRLGSSASICIVQMMGKAGLFQNRRQPFPSGPKHT